MQEIELDINNGNDNEEQDRAQMVGVRLARLAHEQVQAKADIEKRWIQDIRQRTGLYDEQTEQALKLANKSRVFFNITAPKCSSAEARLGDMLFPTDDRNWGIGPTPSPELSEATKDPSPVVDPMTGQQAGTVGDAATAVMEQARRAAEAMEREIDDQLTEGQYNIKARDAIHDMITLGTAVLKGPVVVGDREKAWQEVMDEQGNSVHSMAYVQRHRPDIERVDPWDFFPDMTAATLGDAEFIFQRHYMLPRQLRALALRPGFIHASINELLKTGPKSYRSNIDRLNQMRQISGLSPITDDGRYEVWEYHGPLEADELRACGCEIDEDDEGEASEAGEYDAVVWFCGPYVLKAHLNIMESGERIYSVANWEQDDTCIFGFGIPYQLRNEQRVVNAAWRMAVENGALSVGPQIVVNKSLIEPADGNWEISDRKVWFLKDKNRSVHEAFGAFSVESMQQELMNLFETARRMADDTTNMPNIASSDQAPQLTGTALGTSMLMNASNVTMRKAVRSWDDHITVPMITRYYDWNMQFNDKREIKGDFKVKARGSSALLVKELQQQNLSMLGAQYAAHPVFGPMTKAPELYRKIVQASHISPEDVILSDDEIEKMQQQMAQQGQQADPAAQIELAKLQQAYKIHQEKMAGASEERQTRLVEKQIEREIAITKLSADQNISIQKINAQLEQTRIRESNRRDLASAEMRIKSAMGSGI